LGNTIIIVSEDAEQVNESRMRLARVGIEKIAGYLHNGVIGWAEAGLELDSLPQLTVHDLHELCSSEPETIALLDVREAGERESGLIEGSHWIPLGKLEGKLESNIDELDRAKLVVVQCRSGYRSSIATSLLQRAGFSRVANLTGGFDAWKAAGFPCVTPATVTA
jgi:hydroxyacylglutathione hydrolase